MPFATTVINGGLDLITAPQAVQPGRLLTCSNYEAARVRGIRRMDGYEKYDGGASPSSAGSDLLVIEAHGIASPPDPQVGDAVRIIIPEFFDVAGNVVNVGVSSGSNLSVSIKLTEALPEPASQLAGKVFFDDTNSSIYSIISASQGFVVTGIPAPTGLSLGTVNSSTGNPTSILPGTALGYRVSAYNANGETFASVEATITTPSAAATTTTAFPVVGPIAFQILVVNPATVTVGQILYVSDGVNSIFGRLGSIVGSNIGIGISGATVTGNPTLIAIGSNVIIASYVTMFWTPPTVPAGVPAITVYGVYGRTASAEQLISTVNIGNGNTIPYFTDDGSITPNGALPVNDTTGTVGTYLTELNSFFNTISATIQQVPGQGNVNGVFWLNDILYATRDFFAVNFTAGTVEPNIGDTLYQGLNLGAATWQGQVFKIVLSSGSWSSTGTGNAAGVIMFYNVLGTISAATALNNNTQSLSSIATAGTSGLNAATSTAAGLYAAIGGRGATIPTQSWQLCDLGWNIQYNNGVADFVDMNVALTQANVATNSQQYKTTDWKQATSGSLSGSHWTLGGGTWPGVVSKQGDSQYVYEQFFSGINNFPKPGTFTLTGFGFTDADIPANASVTGIEIQFVAGAIGISVAGVNQYTASPIDGTFHLIGLASGQQSPLPSSTLYPVTPSAPNTDPIGSHYDRYNFATYTFGAPTNVANTPTSLLGYTSITPADVVNANFGVTYGPALSGVQTQQKIQFGMDFFQIRFSYLPQTNQIYFWDGIIQRTVTDGVLTAGSKTMTSATAAFTSADVGKTVEITGSASLIDTVADGVMAGASNTLTSATAAFTAAMVGDNITVGGAGAQSGSTVTDGVTTATSRTLTSATFGFTAADVGKAVTVTGGTGGAAVTAMVTDYISPTQIRMSVVGGVTGTGATVKLWGTLTTTISGYTNPATVTLTAASTTAVSASTVNIYGPFNATIVTINSGTSVELSKAADFAVTGATVNFYQPVLAQVVQHYQQGGDNSTSNAYGALYFQFIQPNGTVGGLPVREVGANEEIRTIPTNGRAPDGGTFDGSLLLADTSTAAAMNTMDWSALLQGQPQPDGTNAPPSKYQSVTENFFASSGLNAIYGVSGGGPAFYFDGIKTLANGNTSPGNFSRILTGLPLQFDTPRSVVSHQGLIILGYYSGVIQWSNNANVLSFNPILDGQTAGDKGFGSRIMGMASINGDSLCVWTPSKVQMMQGNFNIPAGSQTTPSLYTSTISPTSGGIEYTIQPMANYMYCDFRGITAIGATQKYGDFELGHYSSDIAPFIIPRVQLSSFFEGPNIGIINSVLIRNKNMVRYFFADGAALSMTFLADNENPQFTIQNYTDGNVENPQPLTWDVVQAFTESLGRDRIFGATNDGTGWVYELERANSFNGNAITAYATLVPDTAQTPWLNKIFQGINIFGQAQDYATFTLSRSADYTATDQAIGGNVINGIFGSASSSPTGDNAAFLTYATSGLMIEGTAINLRFDSSSDEQFPHVIQAVSYTIDEGQEKQQ